jgi:hypothetical protein
MTRCRNCGSPNPPHERYCNPTCRRMHRGLAEVMAQKDAGRGWIEVTKQIRRPTWNSSRQ